MGSSTKTSQVPKLKPKRQRPVDGLPKSPEADVLATSAAEESFLIPTAVPSEASKLTSPSPASRSISNRLSNLESVSSSFFVLPISYDDGDKVSGYLYISPKASFPLSEQPIEEDKAPDGRTLFITNLPRHTTAQALARLFSQPLSVAPTALEVSLHESQDRLSASIQTMNLLERDSQVAQLAAARPKKPKKGTDNSAKTGLIPALFSAQDAGTADDRARRLLPTAHVRFETAEQLKQILMIEKCSLPLPWPEDSHPDGWMACYRARRRLSRPSPETAKAHTDQWMAAFESGLVPPLPRAETLKPACDEAEAGQDDADDGEGWTVVTRGGQHGRSSTLPTQPQPSSRGADPYAQSSMAGRDEGAGAKVMKRGFAQSFSKTEADIPANKKRKGGQLDTSFYRSNLKETKKAS